MPSQSPLACAVENLAASKSQSLVELRTAILQLGQVVKHALGGSAELDPAELARAVEAIADSKENDLSLERISVLLDSAQLLYTMGHPFEALRPARVAIDLAASGNVDSLHRRALNFFGVVSADTGNIAQAVEAYAGALELAEKLHDTAGKCSCLSNLGVALLNCAQYRDALTCFEKVVQIAGGETTLKPFRLTALSNIALCCLHLEDFSRGLAAAETAVKESPTPQTRSDLLARVLRENNYVRLLLETNQNEQALERIKLARRYAEASGSARAEIAAAIAEGLAEVGSGRADLGISRLTSALSKARTISSMLPDCLASLVKAHEVTGQPQRALLYLREMMESSVKAKQENALAHLRLHLQSPEIPASVRGGDMEKQLARREAALKGQVAEQELFRFRIEMLERLAVTAELRDESTGEHSYRVGKLSALLAAEFGCDEGTCAMVELAARLHDIGKIGVPDAILLKPGKLNAAERSVMKAHTTVGAELLSQSNIPQMQMAEDIARHHHEWWNGNGYPQNLSGADIPLAARITALADVFDALTHRRPYKDPWPIPKALEEISLLQGKQFDPDLTALFLSLVDRLLREHVNLDDYLGQAAKSSPFLQARTKIWGTLGGPSDPSQISMMTMLAKTTRGD